MSGNLIESKKCYEKMNSILRFISMEIQYANILRHTNIFLYYRRTPRPWLRIRLNDRTGFWPNDRIFTNNFEFWLNTGPIQTKGPNKGFLPISAFSWNKFYYMAIFFLKGRWLFQYSYYFVNSHNTKNKNTWFSVNQEAPFCKYYNHKMFWIAVC